MLRSRFTIFLIIVLAIVLGAACVIMFSLIADKQPETATPVASVPTLHPTFTPTPVLPTSTPLPPTPVPPSAEPTQTPASQPVEGSTQTPVSQPVEEATPEPPPTVEPPTPTPDAVRVEVTSATVNLRSGPGTNYKRVGQASQGQVFDVTGRNESGGWFQIKRPDGSSAWIVNDKQWTQPIGDTMSVAVVQNIPAPPPTAKPAPTKPPVPTNTPAPTFRFAKRSNEARINSNPIVTFFGGLYNKNLDSPISGYNMVAVSPSGERKEIPFGPVFLRGDPGLPGEFIYNAKIEFPLAGGVYKIFVADPGGNQVSELWEATVAGEMRTFLPRWMEK